MLFRMISKPFYDDLKIARNKRDNEWTLKVFHITNVTVELAAHT